MILEPFFTGDSYDTPDDAPRALADRLVLGSRAYFAARIIGEVVRCRSLALKGLYDRKAWAESSLRIVRLIESVGGRFHMRGLDRVRACRPPVVIIGNHMSTLETFVLPSLIATHMEVTFVVKESLVSHPIFGPVMRSRNPIAVTRENPREDFETVMTKGKELLAKGASIIVFPQSTRSVEFVPSEFNSMGIKLARASRVPVLPVAVKTDFWGNGKYLKDLGPIDRSKPIYIAFGELFTVAGTGKEEHQRTIEFIVNHLREWGGKIKDTP